MKSQSIEYGRFSQNPDPPEFIRKAFRVPIEEAAMVALTIAQERYTVADISMNGVGISVINAETFETGQVLEECELIIGGFRTGNLKGRIVHISRNDDDLWQCGIHWVDIPEETSNQIAEMVSRMKAQLLKDGTISFESSD